MGDVFLEVKQIRENKISHNQKLTTGTIVRVLQCRKHLLIPVHRREKMMIFYYFYPGAFEA